MEKHILSREINIIRSALKENGTLKEAIDSISCKMNILNEINELLSLPHLDLDKKLATLLDLVMQLVPTEAGSILLREDDILRFKVARGPKADAVVKYPLRIGEGIAGYVVEENIPVIISNPLDDSRFARNIAFAIDYIPYNLLVVPLRGRDKVIGVLELLNSKKNFLEEEAELLVKIGAQLATIIENSILIEEMNKKIKNLEVLLYANRMVNSELNLDSLLLLILALVNDIFLCEGSSILLLEGNNLVFKATLGKHAHLVKDMSMPKDKGVAGWVLNNCDVIYIPDVSKDTRFYIEIDAFTGFETKSIIAAPLKIKDRIIGVIEGVNLPKDSKFTREDKELLAALADSAALAIENAQLYKSYKEIGFAIVASLASAIDLKDPFTFGHSKKVAELSESLAEAYGLSKEEIEKIKLAAILHDIGKIGIEDKILRKEEPLSEAEFNIIKRHPELGASIISSLPHLAYIVPAVLQHHERWDGRGYPFSLKGESISLQARIIAICDAYDALTSSRPYKKNPLSPTEAQEEINRCAGEDFDPKLAKLFIEILKNKKI